MAGRAWTDEERAYLRRAVGRFSYRHISFCLGRSRRACEIKAAAMGLTAKRGSSERIGSVPVSSARIRVDPRPKPVL